MRPVMVGMLVAVVGCIPTGTKQDSGFLSEAEVVELKDHPERFDGRTLNVEMEYREVRPLREAAGTQPLEFCVVVWPNGKYFSLSLPMTCPKSLDYPNLTHGEKARVVFVVGKGGTEYTAKSITR